jgi:hypothetical protein
MKKFLLYLLVASLIPLPGCIIVRFKARTVLTLSPNTENTTTMTLGFRNTTWAVVDNTLMIIGRGWHPREHETYAFVINEGHPAFWPRWLLVTPTPTDEYEIVLWCWRLPFSDKGGEDGMLFTGTIGDVEWSQGENIVLHLNELLLSSPDQEMSLLVSGRIVAKAETPSYVKKQLRFRTDEIEKKRKEEITEKNIQ